MGLLESVKQGYYSLEEKYYDFLDKVNDKIPVYEIVDPIDKVFPSFIIFSAIFLVILLLLAGTVISIVFPSVNDSLVVSVKDPGGKAIEGATVTFLKGGTPLSRIDTDASGIARQTGVKAGDEIEVRAEKQDYLSTRKTAIIAELPQALNIELQKESDAFAAKTIRLFDRAGGNASGNFTLKFRCSDPYAPSIQDITLTPADNGVANVMVPNTCGRLSVDVSDSAAFREVYGFAVTGSDQIIYLDGIAAQSGTINVNVADTTGKSIDGISAELYRYSEILANPNVGPIDVDYTSGGQASFSKAPGDYMVKTYDASGSYGEAASQRISLGADETKSVNLVVQENVRGQIKIRVVDRKSQARVKGASVKLLFSSSSEELTTLKADDGGEISFNISRVAEYKAFVNADGYQLGTVSGLTISDSFVTVQLDKCTPTTCGSLVVKVVDQDNEPIRNAFVSLYNNSTNFVAGYNQRSTDINGTAKFFGVSSGNYYAFAFKEGFSGRSDAAYFSTAVSAGSGPNLTVTMEVGEGIVRVNLKDSEGNPVSFPRIGIFDARTNELVGSDFAGADGNYEVSLKANRQVYVVATKKDEQVYADYTTVKKPIIPEGVQEFNLKLEKPILKDNVELEFIGLYDAANRGVQNVKAGEKYIAKFRLRIPEEKDYDEVGVHIRTGMDVLMEKDKLDIKAVNAAKTSQARATRFEGDGSGLSEDDYEITDGEAKWVNVRWNNPLAGVYEVEAEIQVKDSAALGENLFMFYRAWGNSSGETDRFPEDDTVSEELYSNAKQEIFQVGIVTLCDENFCFKSTITDEENDFIDSVTDTYNARVFNPYKIQFVITNNSETRIHNNANLRIKNPDESIKFFDYTITDAQTRQTQGVVNGFEFPRLNVGNLLPKNSIMLEAEFTPQKAINGVVNIQLVSDQVIVFEKNLTLIVSSPKELDAEVEPMVYLSGIQNDVTVSVKDSASGLEIENAIVRLKDRAGNVLDYSTTAKDGTAVLTLPGQEPGEKLKIEIEKIDYNVKIIELNVTDRLLEITPAQIGVALNTKNKTQSSETISLRNVAPYDLYIKEIKLGGTFRNLLDTASIRNWLESSYRGMPIKAGEKQDIALKTSLSQDALALSDHTDLDGKLTIVAGNFGQEWVFNVPVKIAIGLGSEVDNPACLIITKSEWQTSTNGTPAKTEFQIQNNCTVGGKPIALQDLQAKVNWKTNQLGEYTLAFGDDQVILRGGYNRLLLGTMQKEQALTAILTFTPFGGVNGVAESDIVISAVNPLDGEDQVLENTMHTKITSINLKQCLQYDKESLDINQKESGTFTITATESCGEPVEFEIQSDLITDPAKQFTLQPGQSQKVQVFAQDNYPGQYPVYVLPNFFSDKREQLAKNLKVRINAPGCWQLSKYEFDVYDSPKDQFDGFDVANLTNTCPQKAVGVKVNLKSWGDAAKNGLAYGLAAMALTWLGNYTDPNIENKFLGTAAQPGGQSQNLSPLEKEVQDLQTKVDAAKKTKTLEAQRDTLLRELESLQTNANSQVAQNNLAISNTSDQAKITALQLKNENLMKRIQELELMQNQVVPPVVEPTPAPTSANLPATGNAVLPPVQGLVAGITGSATGTNYPRQLSTTTPYQSSGTRAQQTAGQPPSGQNFLQGIGGGAGSSLGGGLAGGITSGGLGLLKGILGNNPVQSGLFYGIVGTVASYYFQDSETTFTTLQKDVEIKSISLVQGSGSLEQPDSDIGVEVEGLGGKKSAPTVPQPLVNNADLISQGIENMRTIFTNISSLTTTEEKPKYSQLKVSGTRHEYADKTYTKEDFTDPEGGFLGFFTQDTINQEKTPLEEKGGQSLEQRFNLEFNSVPPMVETVQPASLLNCQAGTKVGSTGEDALPKVKFDWTWSGIDEKQCNEDNGNGIYCDATQFTIALMKKINAISGFVAQNASNLKCPSPLEDQPAESEIGSFDIGVSKVSVAKDGTKALVSADITNTNPGIISALVSIKAVKAGNAGTVNCASGAQSISVAAGGKQSVSCEFNGLAEGFYVAQVSITPSISCENCQDISASNSLTRNFFAGETGLQQCVPYSTSRLDEFLQASGIKNDAIVKMAKFNATLMVDGYSSDFQHDFDVAQNETFFRAPDFYTDRDSGLGVYFRDAKLFNFDAYSQPDYALPGPGTYNVVIDINYADNSWQLFDAQGNPKAKISVRLEKLRGAEPDSPFYYLPFDGPLGNNGRTGYGLNYAGDSVIIDNSATPVRTVDIAGSSPIQNGTLGVSISGNFRSMQADNRGVIAKVSRANDNPSLLFQPSNATPVILQIDKKSKGDAYAIYQVGVDGDATDVGNTMSLWNGIGVSCRGFDDSVMAQQQFVPDTHGISAQCALVGANERSKYALEFCERNAPMIDFGSVFYETVFYTPQASNSYVQLTDGASDKATLIGAATSGTKVTLNGNGVTSKIGSLQDVFDLVKDEYVCVSGTNINAEFFWNPKKIFSTIQNKEDQALNACISSASTQIR
ncbi:MAG: carboxypeptidase-like regulatory domain-containing protein [archaeon]